MTDQPEVADPDADLIERLRRTAPPSADVSAMGFMPALIKMAFAAVREREVEPILASLAAATKRGDDLLCDVTLFYETRDGFVSTIEAQKAEIERLRSALEPFAEAHTAFLETGVGPASYTTTEEFREAFAALTPT